jgi:flagellar assembly factor FliW
MKIKTKPFGEIEVSEKQQIDFKNGILGFEDIKTFFLLDAEKDSPFYWLQAKEIPEIAFVIIDPAYVVENYKLDIAKKDLDDLDIKDQSDMLILSIVTIYEKPEDITVNLLGPIIINKNLRRGKQVINQNDEYEIKHPLLSKKGDDNANS